MRGFEPVINIARRGEDFARDAGGLLCRLMRVGVWRVCSLLDSGQAKKYKGGGGSKNSHPLQQMYYVFIPACLAGMTREGESLRRWNIVYSRQTIVRLKLEGTRLLFPREWIWTPWIQQTER